MSVANNKVVNPLGEAFGQHHSGIFYTLSIGSHSITMDADSALGKYPNDCCKTYSKVQQIYGLKLLS